MKKIILASGSLQRRKLLKSLGIKFTIKVSRIHEIKKIRSSCAHLVKKNAILKAQDVASREKNGIIIGADTVVYMGNKKIILKPKDMKDARRILRILSSKPQWVYTGIAIIDKKKNKMIVDYEKTKVFMTPLTKKEMMRYHSKINPFDKAGGFDIEGWGSIFIHRIEGCYTNVIGLPMATLARHLKDFGVNVL